MAAERKGLWFFAVLLLVAWSGGTATAAEPDVAAASCYECHDVIASLQKGAKHEGVNCTACRSGLQAHLKDPGPRTRPATDFSWYACGACHAEQLESFLATSYHRPARDEKSQITNRSLP